MKPGFMRFSKEQNLSFYLFILTLLTRGNPGLVYKKWISNADIIILMDLNGLFRFTSHFDKSNEWNLGEKLPRQSLLLSSYSL